MAWKICFGCKRDIDPHSPWGESWVKISLPRKTIRKNCHKQCHNLAIRMIIDDYTGIKFSARAKMNVRCMVI